jgi:hypothetical protein
MGKTGKQRKKRRLQREQQAKFAATGRTSTSAAASPGMNKKSRPNHSADSPPSTAPMAQALAPAYVGGIPLRDIVATVRTLYRLGTDPPLFNSKPLKQLRIAVHAFHHSDTWMQTNQSAGKSLSGRVADALRDRRLIDAYRFLDGE